MGVLQLEKERARSRVSESEGERRRTKDSRRFFPPGHALKEGKEEKAISYHNTLLIANCDAETEEGGSA